MPLRGGHGVILFIALIEWRYVLFMEKTSENTVQVWKNKKIKHWMLIAFFLCFYDIVAVNLSYIFGLFIRFDLTFSAIPKEYMLAYVKFAPIYTAFCVVVFFVFKLYNSLWRFASIGELSRIFLASLVTTIFQAVGITLLFMRMPVAYYIVGAGTQFVLITAVRFAYRYVTLLRAKQVTNQVAVHNAMVIGAGASGQMILKELTMSERANARPLCIIDDNPNKWGRNIGGVPIVGGRDCIMESVKKYNIDQILFAIPTASPENKRDILNICKETGCEMKQLIIFDIYENNAYEIEQELKRKYGSKLNLVTLIGSVRDSRRINDVFEKYKPDIVYHAAAHKHVPLMETSPNEAIKNNVVGTYKTAYAALKHGTKRFVLISTDKAVNPTNIMGASKRLCEMVIQSMDAISKAGRTDLLPMLHAHVDEMTDGMLADDPIDEIAVDNIESSEAVKIESVGNKDRNGTQFVAVRFGNVLGSNGSVIPLFKKQIEAGGPVTVTHPDIIRYFMTIPEAVSLVLQAGTYAWGGEIFVLDMGAPVKIDTLARNLIRLSGYKPDVDIKIVYSGLRPGEKLFEEKLMAEEGMMKTDNELIHIGKPIPFDTETFLGQLGELARASYNNDENIVEMVEKIVPTFSPVGDKPTGNEKYGRNDVAVSAAK